MNQQELPLLHRLDGPAVVPPQLLKGVKTFRDAVLLCWALRRDKSSGAQSACARYIGAQVSHMSDYLSDDPAKRDMPAKYIKAIEVWCGNTAISQHISSDAHLTVVEEMQAMRAAA